MKNFDSNFYQTFSNASVRSRGRMLHLEADNAFYSLTYRLADSLPKEVARELYERKLEIVRKLERADANALQRSEMLEQLYKESDRYLDKGYGSCLMAKPEIASMVQDTLRFHDGKLYDLKVWNVMPNHAHAAIRLYRGRDLAKVLHSWKSLRRTR